MNDGNPGVPEKLHDRIGSHPILLPWRVPRPKPWFRGFELLLQLSRDVSAKLNCGKKIGLAPPPVASARTHVRLPQEKFSQIQRQKSFHAFPLVVAGARETARPPLP